MEAELWHRSAAVRQRTATALIEADQPSQAREKRARAATREKRAGCSSLLFDLALGGRPWVPGGEHPGPGGEAAVAVCGVNCRRWQLCGLQDGTVPSRGLTVRLRRSDAETKRQEQEQQQAAAAKVSRVFLL